MEHIINQMENDVEALKKELEEVKTQFEMQDTIIRVLMLGLRGREEASLARFSDLYTRYVSQLPDSDFRIQLEEYFDHMVEFAEQFLPLPNDE